MIVDDHELYRFGLRELLADSKSFRVIAEASNYRDALVRLQSVSVDLVLLDFHLPDVNGMEALHQLKKNPAAPDIIIISATIDDDILLDALLAGISGYLTKDTPAIEMLNALNAYQQGELALSSGLASRAIRLLLQHSNRSEDELAFLRRNEMKVFVGSKSENVSSPGPPPIQVTKNILPVLTPQEDKVYQLMSKGLSNKQIAAELCISRFTVGKHVQNILRKLGVTNRTQAASYNLFEGDPDC
jgi:two-component system nitrate/nitrite response regulator NarL